MSTVDELREPEYAAEKLRLDRVTVLRYARRGLIESVRIGNKRLFRDSAIQAFIESRVQPAGAPAPAARPAPTSARPARNPNRTYKT